MSSQVTDPHGPVHLPCHHAHSRYCHRWDGQRHLEYRFTWYWIKQVKCLSWRLYEVLYKQHVWVDIKAPTQPVLLTRAQADLVSFSDRWASKLLNKKRLDCPHCLQFHHPKQTLLYLSEEKNVTCLYIPVNTQTFPALRFMSISS